MAGSMTRPHRDVYPEKPRFKTWGGRRKEEGIRKEEG
jgi:hypothetical protein